MYACAVASCEGLLAAMRSLVQEAGGTFTIPPGEQVVHDAPPLTTRRCVATVKAILRAREKVELDYDGDARRVVDLVRASGLFETPTALTAALSFFDSSGTARLSGAPSLRLVRIKDKFNHPTAGYRDLLLNGVLADEGTDAHVAELQLHPRAIFNEKKTAHVSYGIARGLQLDAAVSPVRR